MAVTDTKTVAVTLKEIKGATKSGGNGQYEIQIPRFQRGQVWSKKMQEMLIESIRDGYPIGSLLAFERYEQVGNGKGRVVWSLIDGLQRTSTIVEYLNDPFTVAKPDLFYSESSIVELTRLCFSLPSPHNRTEVKHSLDKWLKERRSPSKENNFYAEHLVSHLEQEILKGSEFETSKRREISTYLDVKLLEEIKSKIDAIEEAKLPFIVYSGDEANLSVIFERINTQGTSLTKYETFAASWYGVNVEINNAEIREKIRNKYKVLSDKGYEFTDLDDLDSEFSSYNLFEYLFGLGRILAQRFPLLFPNNSKDDETIPAAFVICSVAHQIKTADLKEMGRLSEKLKEIYGGTINLFEFEKALIETCQSVENSLRPFLDVKLNAKSNTTTFYAHSNNQIYSYIARLLIELFDHENNWKARPNNSSEKLLENIPLYYVFDIIRSEWSGSGDSRLFSKTWESIESSPDSTETTFAISKDYLQTITLNSWNSALLGWQEDELSGLQRDRTNVSMTAKLLLKFLYQEKLNVAENARETFHIEHLWSVDKLKKMIKEMKLDGLPIGSFANLTLLPKKVNEAKGTEMLGDFYRKKRETLTEDRWAMIQKLVISPQISDLLESRDLSKKAYLDFLENRFQILRLEILKQVGFLPEQINSSKA
jgi:hypothetical protein